MQAGPVVTLELFRPGRSSQLAPPEKLSFVPLRAILRSGRKIVHLRFALNHGIARPDKCGGNLVLRLLPDEPGEINASGETDMADIYSA